MRLGTLVILLSGHICQIYGDSIKLTDYYKMPPLYIEDEYRKCLDETENESVFCSTITTIKPDNSSLVWKNIEEFSSDHLRHFRHDMMYSGFCINWCNNKLANAANVDDLFEEEFDIEHEYYNDVIKNTRNQTNVETMTFRKKYDRTVNQCMNLYLLANYGLRGYTTISSCVSNQKSAQKDEIRLTNIAFVTVLAVIIVLVLVSSYYDSDLHKLIMKKKSHAETADVRETILEIFSLRRNWRRLVSSPQSKRGRELRWLQGIRYNNMFIIIFGHLMYAFTRIPIQNPQFYEEKYYTLSGMLGLNGYYVVQTFFMISGLLMGLAFKDIIEQRSFKLSYCAVAFFYRHIRLTPVYALVLLFETTSYMKPHGHPIWETRSEMDQAQCQNNWWLNLLYINNIFRVPQICMPHTWYLAADFQIFMYGLLFMMLAWRFPKRRVLILSIGLIITVIMPVIVTYARGYSGIYVATPEDYKYHLFQDAFQHFYVPGYTNAGNYFAAMIIGLHYDLLKDAKYVKVLKYPSLVILYLAIPIGIIPLMSSWIFYNMDIDVTAWWIAPYVIFTKHYFAFIACAFLVVFSNNLDKMIVAYFNTPIWQPLGRLTYSAYLVHLAVERIVAMDKGNMLYVTNLTIVTGTITNLVISSLIALFLCLFVEFPSTAFIKILIKGDKESLKIQPQIPMREQETPCTA